MKALSLFTGCGGLDLAAEMAGIEIVGQCEIDNACNKVLEHWWPDVPKWRDVKDVTEHKVKKMCGHIDLIFGGFPCQPHSVIGSRKAEKDERHLWPEFMRIVRELRPSYVVGENVNGILSTVHESVCADLEGEDYTVRTFSIPAYAVGAHHERYRVFIIGISDGESRFQTNTKYDTIGESRKTRKITRLKSWDYLPGTYWAAHKPPICGMVDGFPCRMGEYKDQMKMLGNAVVPQQAYPLFLAIMNCGHASVF